jgi:hypothetical protein
MSKGRILEMNKKEFGTLREWVIRRYKKELERGNETWEEIMNQSWLL